MQHPEDFWPAPVMPPLAQFLDCPRSSITKILDDVQEEDIRHSGGGFRRSIEAVIKPDDGCYIA